MPFIVLLVLATAASTAAALLVLGLAARSRDEPAPVEAAARAAGRSVRSHRRLRAALADRLDPETATGLALTAALVLAVGGGLVLGVLAYLVRSDRQLLRIDDRLARWGDSHATAASTHALDAVTQLGSTPVVVALGVIVTIVAVGRSGNLWPLAFLVVVVAGEKLLTTTIKDLADRVRPAFNPVAETLGPSFPSGHSATAASFFAAAALLLGRDQGPRVRALLAGLAVGIAVAVAASRVLLDVHWTTDTIAGLALGWAWFAICAIAFGGRVMRFGAAAQVASDVSRPRRRPPAAGRS